MEYFNFNKTSLKSFFILYSIIILIGCAQFSYSINRFNKTKLILNFKSKKLIIKQN